MATLFVYGWRAREKLEEGNWGASRREYRNLGLVAIWFSVLAWRALSVDLVSEWEASLESNRENSHGWLGGVEEVTQWGRVGTRESRGVAQLNWAEGNGKAQPCYGTLDWAEGMGRFTCAWALLLGREWDGSTELCMSGSGKGAENHKTGQGNRPHSPNRLSPNLCLPLKALGIGKGTRLKVVLKFTA